MREIIIFYQSSYVGLKSSPNKKNNKFSRARYFQVFPCSFSGIIISNASYQKNLYS